MTDLSAAQWRKSSRSTGSNGACVEVAINLPGITAIRDSKNPGGQTLVISRTAFAALLTGIKNSR
jgi:hypothetical protein